MSVQDDQAHTMSKAQKMKQSSGSSSTGIPLLSSFPYSRLSTDQIVDLFHVYQIKLGSQVKDCRSIIECIQQIDRSRFEQVVKTLLSQPRKDRQLVTLDLDILTNSEFPVVT